MCRYTNSDDFIIFTVLIKFNKYVALMTVNYQYLVCASRAAFNIFIEVLNSVQTSFIISPFSNNRLNYLIVRKT